MIFYSTTILYLLVTSYVNYFYSLSWTNVKSWTVQHDACAPRCLIQYKFGLSRIAQDTQAQTYSLFKSTEISTLFFCCCFRSIKKTRTTHKERIFWVIVFYLNVLTLKTRDGRLATHKQSIVTASTKWEYCCVCASIATNNMCVVDFERSSKICECALVAAQTRTFSV